jgi:hypothetical protein
VDIGAFPPVIMRKLLKPTAVRNIILHQEKYEQEGTREIKINLPSRNSVSSAK